MFLTACGGSIIGAGIAHVLFGFRNLGAYFLAIGSVIALAGYIAGQS
jgi:hypothetical protein